MAVKRLRWVVAASLLLAAEAPAAHADSAAAAETFVAEPCWFRVSRARNAVCGKLTVPERRIRPTGRQLRLPVVIFKHAETVAAREPIVFLTGGPGQPSYIADQSQIDGWWEWINYLPQGHDLIVFDQRGTGRAEPRLDCPKLADPRIWAGAAESIDDVGTTPTALQDAAVACRDRLLGQGHTLSAFNSFESAADGERVAALKRGLNLRHWSLFGVSYGTRLALTVMRYYPEGVRTAILDSVFPPDAFDVVSLPQQFDRALTLLFDQCLAQPRCAEAYPEVASRFKAALRRLESNPVTLNTEKTDHWPALFVRVDETMFLDLVFAALRDAELVEILPELITQTGNGDYGPLTDLAQEFYMDESYLEFADGMSLSVTCHDEFPFENSAAIKAAAARYPLLAGWLMQHWSLTLCPLWPAGRAAPIENTPVTSDIPTLLLAGAYDPITPPTLAHRAAEALPFAHVVAFPGTGHGVFDSHRCAEEVVKAFLDSPHRRPSPDCLSRLRPPDFDIASQPTKWRPRHRPPPHWR